MKGAGWENDYATDKYKRSPHSEKETWRISSKIKPTLKYFCYAAWKVIRIATIYHHEREKNGKHGVALLQLKA